MADHEDVAHERACGCVKQLERLDEQVMSHAMEAYLERLQVIAGITARGVENVFLAIWWSQAI